MTCSVSQVSPHSSGIEQGFLNLVSPIRIRVRARVSRLVSVPGSLMGILDGQVSAPFRHNSGPAARQPSRTMSGVLSCGDFQQCGVSLQHPDAGAYHREPVSRRLGPLGGFHQHAQRLPLGIPAG